MGAKSILSFVGILSLATRVRGQTKISGTLQCPKPDTHYAIDVGDRAGHSFLIERFKCARLLCIGPAKSPK